MFEALELAGLAMVLGAPGSSTAWCPVRKESPQAAASKVHGLSFPYPFRALWLEGWWRRKSQGTHKVGLEADHDE